MLVATPRSSARRRTVGNRSPGCSAPRSTWAASWDRICSYGGVLDVLSRSITVEKVCVPLVQRAEDRGGRPGLTGTGRGGEVRRDPRIVPAVGLTQPDCDGPQVGRARGGEREPADVPVGDREEWNALPGVEADDCLVAAGTHRVQLSDLGQCRHDCLSELAAWPEPHLLGGHVRELLGSQQVAQQATELSPSGSKNAMPPPQTPDSSAKRRAPGSSRPKFPAGSVESRQPA